MRLFILVLSMLFGVQALAAPKSLNCVFDFDDSLILKLAGDFKPDRKIGLTQIQLFGKEEGEEDSDLIGGYAGPTEVTMESDFEVSWKFDAPSDDNDYGSVYSLTIPKDYEQRLSVMATLATGGWSKDRDYAGPTLSGSCMINQ